MRNAAATLAVYPMMEKPTMHCAECGSPLTEKDTIRPLGEPTCRTTCADRAIVGGSRHTADRLAAAHELWLAGEPPLVKYDAPHLQVIGVVVDTSGVDESACFTIEDQDGEPHIVSAVEWSTLEVVDDAFSV